MHSSFGDSDFRVFERWQACPSPLVPVTLDIFFKCSISCRENVTLLLKFGGAVVIGGGYSGKNGFDGVDVDCDTASENQGLVSWDCLGGSDISFLLWLRDASSLISVLCFQ